MLEDILRRGKTPLVVGGSTMWVDWLLRGVRPVSAIGLWYNTLGIGFVYKQACLSCVLSCIAPDHGESTGAGHLSPTAVILML